MRVLWKSLCLLALIITSGCTRSERADVKKIKVGDVELAYYTRGSGEPLVMIMGFRGTMAVWDPAFLDLLAKKYQLILFDNRGVGKSTDSAENNTTIEQMAIDTIGLVEALGIKKTHVLGWSMGSLIAMEMALRNPEMVDHLILCSPNPGGRFRAARKSDAYEKLTAPILKPEDALALIFPTTEIGKKSADAFYHRLEKAIALGSVPNDLEISNETVKRQVLALSIWDKDERVYERLPDIKNTTLVAGGVDDDIDSPENVLTVASRIPFAWTAYFSEAGHDFLSQDHETFAQLIILFTQANQVR